MLLCAGERFSACTTARGCGSVYHTTHPALYAPSVPPRDPHTTPCPTCGYDLQGLIVARCPECGGVVALGYDLADLAEKRKASPLCAVCRSKAPPTASGACPACGAKRAG